MESLTRFAQKNFEDYYASFSQLTPQQERNFAIKYDHSLRVADNAIFLAQELKLNERDQAIAYLIGMYHDIGRFKQLIEFNTFNDSVSVDHAKYSIQVIDELNYLDQIEEAPLIIAAIWHHNKRIIPENLSDKALLFSKLIRDADKLDIYRVVTEHYQNKNASENGTLTWEKPAGETVSPNVAEQILSGQMVSRENVMSQIDFKVLQLSWVYDINFKATYKQLLKSNHLKIIYNALPKDDISTKIYNQALSVVTSSLD